MSLVALVQELNDAYRQRAPWAVVRDLTGGSQGAFLVQDRDGHEAVVKLHPGADVAEFVAVQHRVRRLRARGVPAPDMDVIGVASGAVLLLEVLPGSPDPPMTMPLVEHLLDIISMHSAAADTGPWQWRSLMRSSLTEGLNGYCEHVSLRQFSDASRHQLARILAVGDAVNFDALPAHDLVHYDLHAANILSVDGNRVSGIVDWDAVRSGDSLLDMAMLTFTSMWRAEPAALRRLWDAFFSVGDDERRSVAMHHTVLRLVDWMIRHDSRAVAARTVAAADTALASVDAGRYIDR